MLKELRKEMNRSGYVMRNSGERCAHSLNSNLHAAGFINSPAKSPALPERIEAVLRLREKSIEVIDPSRTGSSAPSRSPL